MRRDSKADLPGALKLSEGTLFRAIVEHSQDVVAVVGADTTFLYLSPATETVLGHRPAALVGTKALALVHPEDLEGAAEAFRDRLTRPGPGRPHALRCRHADGGWRVLEAVGNTLEQGETVMLSLRDLTERRRAEEELRHAEARFRSLIDNALDVVAVLDPDGVIRYGSPSGEHSLGYASGRLRGVSLYDIVHPLDRSRVASLFERVLRRPDSSPASVEFRALHADGSWRIFEVICKNLLHDPTVRGFLINARDITDRTRAEERFRASERRFRSLFDFNPNAVYQIDLEGRIVSANPACTTLTGYPEARLRELGFQDVIEPDCLESAMSLFQNAVAGEPQYYELALRHRSGKRVEVRGVSVPVVVDDRVEGVFGIIEDVTERKALEEQLRHSQKLEAVGRLAGGIAHDFNNILTAISGHAELIVDTLEPGDPVRSDAEEIARASARAANLTRQLLAFSRKQMLQPRVVDLNAVVEENDRLLGRLIGEDIRIVLSLEPGLGRVEADPTQIEQVIFNLAANARDAMPGGGTLEIGTRTLELADRLRVGQETVPPGRYVRLTVRDSGEGMPPEVQSRIFEPFFSTKAQGRGTGLGLSTVYGIVKQSGGHIFVESGAGRGSLFTILLPAVAGETDDAHRPRRPEASGGTETVLLVEDEAAVRAFTRRVLERKGYTVLDAPDGAAALRLLEAHDETVHLVLSDVVMPGLNGRELAELVCASRPGIRVLFMSGYTEDDVVRRGVSGEGDELLAKPFSPEDLALAVRRALDGR